MTVPVQSSVTWGRPSSCRRCWPWMLSRLFYTATASSLSPQVAPQLPYMASGTPSRRHAAKAHAACWQGSSLSMLQMDEACLPYAASQARDHTWKAPEE